MRTTTILAAALVLGLTSVATAQELTLPRPSPNATATQLVGVTTMGIDYSSPGVKGRTIFGELVPWDKLWRTGANAATKFTTDGDVMIGKAKVPAGAYSVFTIPGKKTWTVIFNSDVNAATRNYDKKKDVARIQVKATAIPKRERLAFIFSNTTDAGTSLDLEWDTLRVSIPIQVDTDAHVAKGIAAFNSGSSRAHANAARYHLEKKDFAAAMTHIDIALAADNNWFNNWIRADILAQKGDTKAACPNALAAWKMGQKADYFFWKERVKKAVDDWGCK